MVNVKNHYHSTTLGILELYVHTKRSILKAKSVQHLQSIGIYDEWETPPSLIRITQIKFDLSIFLDVCATHDNAQFQKYFTKEINGLNQNWFTNFFMNPPYSEIEIWMRKAWNEVQKNKVTGLILTFAKTDTKWFHEFVFDEQKNIWLAQFIPIKGRIKFFKDGVKSKNSAPYPSCWIIMRPQ